MKVLVLSSGGDAPGMNRFIAKLAQYFGNKLYACKGGFKGLYENQIYPIKFFEPQKYANSAGCCIKSSRFPEFKDKEIFDKAIENAKSFDALVILGGNGSQKAVIEMNNAGVKAVFVPCTIDNDVEDSDYSIGFHTAVQSVINAARNIMPSMEAFSRACIFETMGRHCGKIAEEAAKVLQPDLLITKKQDLNKEEIANVINKNFKKEKATMIIIKENIIDIKKLCKDISASVKPADVRDFCISYLQRGSAPTNRELRIAYMFAVAAIKAIELKQLPIATMMQGGKIVLKKI